MNAASALLAIGLLAGSATAHAGRVASMTNEAGGEILLTDVSTKRCGDGMSAAMATGSSGAFVTGCWIVESGYVLIDWYNGSRVTSKAYPILDFKPAADLFDDEPQTTDWPQAPAWRQP